MGCDDNEQLAFGILYTSLSRTRHDEIRRRFDRFDLLSRRTGWHG
jgi:hypothetical protein